MTVWIGGHTFSHVLDGIVVQDLAGIPRVAALSQQVSQGFIVHLDEGGLHGVLPASLPQLAGCLQYLQHQALRTHNLLAACLPLDQNGLSRCAREKHVTQLGGLSLSSQGEPGDCCPHCYEAA